MVTFKPEDIKPMTDEERRRIESIRDEDIDYSDIPPLDEVFFKRAKVGVFYRPIKAPVTMRIDKDILDWLRSKGAGYQTRANQILREAMLAELRHAKTP